MTSTLLRPAALSSALLLALFAGHVAAAAPQAPSLADVARKEQERRKSAPNAAKVYTKSDLPKTAAPAADDGALPPPVAADAQAAPAAAPPPAADEGEKKDEAWWKKRMATAREELRRAEMFAEALQTRINSLARDFSSRDDPAQRRRIGAERAEALNEQARVKQEIEAWKKEIADIEEEARKAGVPPGWLR